MRGSALHLTQLAAATSTTAASTFFRAIAPGQLGNYLNQCLVGGDLLQVLNIAREDRDTFLFRPPVLVQQVTTTPHPPPPSYPDGEGGGGVGGRGNPLLPRLPPGPASQHHSGEL